MVINFLFFLYKIAKNGKQKKVFYVIDFDLIKVLKSLAFQNDSQILIFVKAINVVGKTMPNSSVLQLLVLSDSFPFRV